MHNWRNSWKEADCQKLVNENGEADNREAMGVEMPWNFEKQSFFNDQNEITY